MEVILFTVLAIFGSWAYLKHAPMHEIKDALFIENVANQVHKNERN